MFKIQIGKNKGTIKMGENKDSDKLYKIKIERQIYVTALNMTNFGAINPTEIATSIKESGSKLMHICGLDIKEVCNHPAIQLMVIQLAYICHVDKIENDKFDEIVKNAEEKIDELEKKICQSENHDQTPT